MKDEYQHTDQLLDESSYNPTSHKATLTRRTQLVCDSRDSLADGRKYLDNFFSENNYSDFVKRHLRSLAYVL